MQVHIEAVGLPRPEMLAITSNHIRPDESSKVKKGMGRVRIDLRRVRVRRPLLGQPAHVDAGGEHQNNRNRSQRARERQDRRRAKAF